VPGASVETAHSEDRRRPTSAAQIVRPRGRAPLGASISPWAVALIGGLVVGVGCWAAHEYLPGQAHLLGESAALWLAVAWLAGSRARRPAIGALAGLAAIIVTITAFYLALAGIAGRGEFPATMRFWYVAALVGGPVFGVFGWLRRTRSSVRRGLSAAALGAAFLAEAAIFARHIPIAASDALIAEAAVGLLLPFALSRRWRDAAAAAGWLPILLAAGAVGWVLVFTLYPRLAG
jgi:hypothetical protein